MNSLSTLPPALEGTYDGCKLDHPDFNGPNKFAGWGYFRGERLVRNSDLDADPDQMYLSGANHGTSCAGVIAALTLSANPDLTVQEVVSILKQTASKDLDFQAYPRTPPAVYDPNSSWDVSPVAPFNRGSFMDSNDPDGSWSPWFGHGRADALNAVTEALRRRTGVAEETFRGSSEPDLEIPDNNFAGVNDTIRLDGDALLSAIQVKVDISHTYQGDLRLTLTGPSGASAVLHDRNNGSADNIQRTFDLASTPALGTLLGQSIQGDWTLKVQDLAFLDAGRLNRWELEMVARTNGVVNLEDSPGERIPDNNPQGIERILTANEAGQVKDLEVDIDITHTYIGDLVINLISPDGTGMTLHERTGGSTDNLIKTFSSATTAALQAVRGRPIQGAWRLKVIDLAAVDTGKLNRWALNITRQSSSPTGVESAGLGKQEVPITLSGETAGPRRTTRSKRAKSSAHRVRS